MDKSIENILEELKLLPQVEIISIGGSRARGNYDEKSDYDIYIYYNEYIDKKIREGILNKYTKYMEYGNKYWEEEDDGILKNGIEVEFIYRNVEFLEEVYTKLYLEGNVEYGYTTCNVDNLYNSIIIFDRSGLMNKYKERFKIYPDELRKNIVFKNMELLYDRMPSIGYQVIKAIDRKDIISINNRLSEYFAMYIDIIFALNYKYNIGEKRLIDELKKCKIIPKNAVENIEQLFEICMTDSKKAIGLIENISNDIYKLVLEVFPEYEKSKYYECSNLG